MQRAFATTISAVATTGVTVAATVMSLSVAEPSTSTFFILQICTLTLIRFDYDYCTCTLYSFTVTTKTYKGESCASSVESAVKEFKRRGYLVRYNGHAARSTHASL